MIPKRIITAGRVEWRVFGHTPARTRRQAIINAQREHRATERFLLALKGLGAAAKAVGPAFRGLVEAALGMTQEKKEAAE